MSDFDKITNVIQNINQAVIFLEEQKCGLEGIGNQILDDNIRCTGRCLSSTHFSERCNLKRTSKKWCQFHTEICRNINIGHHAAIDKYTNLLYDFNGKVNTGIYALEGGKYAKILTQKDSRYTIFNLELIKAWDSIISGIDIMNFIESAGTISDLLEMTFRFYIDADLRLFNIYACYYPTTDLGHIRALIISQWIFTKLFRYITGNINYSMEHGLALREGVVNIQDIISRLTLAEFLLDKTLTRREYLNVISAFKDFPNNNNPVFKIETQEDETEKLLWSLLRDLLRQYSQIPKIVFEQNEEEYNLILIIDQSEKTINPNIITRIQNFNPYLIQRTYPSIEEIVNSLLASTNEIVEMEF